MAKLPVSWLIIFGIVFVDLLCFGIVIPILPYYAQTYGASGWELGGLMTCYSLSQFIFAPIWGRLSDRIGRRPVLMMSIFGSVLGMLILGWAPSLLWLFVGRTLAGISAANISTAFAYITDVSAPEQRTKAMGFVGAALGLGFTCGPAVGGVLAAHGYSLPMFVAAGIAFLNLCFAFRFLKESHHRRVMQLNVPQLSKVMHVLKRPSGNAIIVFALFTFAITQLETVFALYMGAAYSFDAQKTGFLMAGIGLVMVLIQGGIVGRLAKRWTESRIAQAALLLCIFGFFSFGSVDIFILAIFSLILISTGRGLLQPSLTSLVSFGTTEQTRGRIMGVFQSGSSLARALGPLTAGWLYDHVSPHSPFFFGALLCLIAFALLLPKKDYSPVESRN